MVVLVECSNAEVDERGGRSKMLGDHNAGVPLQPLAISPNLPWLLAQSFSTVPGPTYCATTSLPTKPGR